MTEILTYFQKKTRRVLCESMREIIKMIKRVENNELYNRE